MQCATWAANGPNHLGLCARQALRAEVALLRAELGVSSAVLPRTVSAEDRQVAAATAMSTRVTGGGWVDPPLYQPAGAVDVYGVEDPEVYRMKSGPYGMHVQKVAEPDEDDGQYELNAVTSGPDGYTNKPLSPSPAKRPPPSLLPRTVTPPPSPTHCAPPS